MSVPVDSPTAFISYSHDSEAHKQWVREFAERLTRDGVQVVLDQWHLELGTGLPLFMERSISSCTYVLLICTENYVEKADARTGGVGYETSMLADLILTQAQITAKGANRLIPVVRQSGTARTLPKCVAGAYYADLSDHVEAAESNYEALVRTLHRTPEFSPPLLGTNPFAPMSANRLPSDTPRRRDNPNELRRELRDLRVAAAAALATDRQSYPLLAGSTLQQRDDELFRVVQTHEAYLKVFLSAALAGSVTPALFAEELEHVITPSGWSLSGTRRVVDFPYAVGWAMHRILGAAVVEQGRAAAAVKFALEKIEVKPGARHPLITIRTLTGWPIYLGNSNEAWEFTRTLSRRWTWLADAFGDSGEYWVAMVAQALALNFAEFRWRLQYGPPFDVIRQDRENSPCVPPYYWQESTDIQRRAFRQLTRDSAGLRESLGLLIQVPNLRDVWRQWIDYQQAWVSIESGGAAAGNAPHRDLIEFVLSDRG